MNTDFHSGLKLRAHLPSVTFLSLILICLLFPDFGRVYDVVRGWADQSLYMRILDDVDAGRTGEALKYQYMGPTYIAFVQAIKNLVGLDSVGALVILNKLSIVLGITFPVFVLGILKRSSRMQVAGTFILFLTFVFSTPFLYASTVPWSHFLLGALGSTFLVALSFRLSILCAFILGALLGLIATVRMFELYSIGIMIALYFAIWLATHTRELLAPKVGLLLGAAVIGFGLAYVSHSLELGELSVFRQYSADGTGGGMSHEAFGGSVLRLQDIPVKLVQFFIDPCYYSYCEAVDYKKSTMLVSAEDIGFSNWRLPFILQIPFYAAALIAGLGLLGRRPSLAKHVFTDPVLLIGLGVAVGVPVGYAAYIMGGSFQLQFGFMREMFFPTLALLVCLLHLLARDYLSTREKTALVAAVAFISIIGLQVLPYFFGFPRLTDQHIASLNTKENCSGADCSIAVEYFNPLGRQINIPFDRLAYVQIGCAYGSTVESDIVDLSSFRFPKFNCQSGSLVSAMSTTAGTARLVKDYRAGGVAVKDVRIPIDGTVKFQIDGIDPLAMYSRGWSTLEPQGIWSTAENATVGLINREEIDQSAVFLRINYTPFLPRESDTSEFEITVNDRLLASRKLRGPASPRSDKIEVPSELIRNGVIDIKFHVSPLLSPSEFGAADTRKLGIMLESIKLQKTSDE
ncbi:hypothetical protein [Rhizobium sp. BK060]|uniref:hypothetical protein n=1 Tax=Rhizobium sp. BK060 TaxID=2587096 RepID=UPI00160EF497|nr:hypothetical protein [Rhizobium sp. BK060]MBB3395047.1 hypothetical protein [Rhizobium sp. BK060]